MPPDEFDRRWAELGERLHRLSPELFEAMFAVLVLTAIPEEPEMLEVVQ